MADRLPTLEVVPILASVQADHAALLDLLPNEWEVLAAVDGVHDLRGIAACLGRSEFDVAKVVYGLVATGVVAVERHHANGAGPTPTQTSGNDAEAAVAAAREALTGGRPEDALRLAGVVIGADGSRVDARLIVVRALRRLHRLGEAAEELRRALEIAPEDPGLRLEQGFAALSRGDFQAAVASWEQYLRIAPPTASDTVGLREAVTSASYLHGFLEAYTSG